MHKFWESWPVLYQKTSLYLSVKRRYFLEFMLAIRFQMCVCAHDLIRKTRTFLGMSKRQPLLPLILPPGSSTNDVTAPLNLSFEHRQVTTESSDHWKAGGTKPNIFLWRSIGCVKVKLSRSKTSLGSSSSTNLRLIS